MKEEKRKNRPRQESGASSSESAASSTEPLYWKGLEERDATPEFQQTLKSEFPEPPANLREASSIPEERPLDRRSFLTAAGFSLAAATLSSCSRSPVETAIPLLNSSETALPGKAYWYASTCHGCSAGCGTLVKTRDGRPIKIEGNPDHPLSKGGLCSVGQAMVLGLYDSRRLQRPVSNGRESSWAELDAGLKDALASVNGGVYVLSRTLTSPTERAVIERFVGRYPESGLIEYDPVSLSAIPDAHERTHGARVLPHYRLDQARVLVSLDADFLGTWISPVEFTKDYTSRRTLETPELSYHVQFESRMSLTGSNADRRILSTPREMADTLTALARRLSAVSGTDLRIPEGSEEDSLDAALVDELAESLWEARGESLVICGTNSLQMQCLVNGINHLLENYGRTLEIERPSLQNRANDQRLFDLLARMRDGQVQALFIAGVNPAYSLPRSEGFTTLMELVPLSVAFSEHSNETTELCNFVCPLHHPLESWKDSEPVSGLLSLSQPAIAPLGETRSVLQCFNTWMDAPLDDREAIRSRWQTTVFPATGSQEGFDTFWNQSVHDGYALVEGEPAPRLDFRPAAVEGPAAQSPGDYTLVLYQKLSMLDGRHAHNPWLHELPDSVTKATWDNYASLSPATAAALGIQEGDILSVGVGEESLELPAQIQPGQHPRVVAIALGYGCQGTERFSTLGPQWLQGRGTVGEGGTVGQNAFRFTSRRTNRLAYEGPASISATGRRTHLAVTQTHHTVTVPEHLGGTHRHMVRETTLAAYTRDPASGNHFEHEVLQLWPQDHQYLGHHWGMAIDLNRCTGCSACVVACQAENNVPVVGKDEVFRRREMHWIRIDRYYSGEGDRTRAIHQPLMCHHCDHAPCEGVCPVLATVHHDEGINQQIYNRCVGTRYCANNCPYKVRRFNWFDYRQKDTRENLVLNPDITTRTRGVMEKCSLCIQRIQEAKLEARRLDRPLMDGEIQLACQQSCPADAIVFGDMNDPESRVSRLIEDPRHYRVLEEMNFRPSVGYLTKVRNSDENGQHE